jgi:hypothetical protein
MSVSPSFPQGAPSLAEVLITRTFAKPTNPFVDGEFLEALEHADDGESKAVAPAKPPTSGSGPALQDRTPQQPPATPAPARATTGSRVDVRV